MLFDDFCNFWLHWRKYLNQLQKFDIKLWHSKRKTHTKTLIHFKSPWKPKLTKPTTNGPHTISLIKPSLPLVNSQLDRLMAVTSVRVSHFQEIRRTRFLVNFTEHLPTKVLHSAPEKNRVRGCGRYKHSFWEELKYFLSEKQMESSGPRSRTIKSWPFRSRRTTAPMLFGSLLKSTRESMLSQYPPPKASSSTFNIKSPTPLPTTSHNS